jgi:hypothetical protein
MRGVIRDFLFELLLLPAEEEASSAPSKGQPELRTDAFKRLSQDTDVC